MAHSVGSGERLREALEEFDHVHMALAEVVNNDVEHPAIQRSHAALDRLEELVEEFLKLYEKNQHDLHDREKELASARRELVGSAGSLGTTHNFLQFDEFITRVHQFNSGSKAPSLTPLIEKLADLSSLRYPVGKKEEKTDSKAVAVVVNALVALCLEAAARYVAIHRHTFAAAAATVPVGCPTAPVPALAPAGPAQPPQSATAAAEYATELRPSPAALAHVEAIPLFTSTWRKLCEAVFADVFAFPRMAAEVVAGPFAALLADTFPAVSEELFADKKLRDAVTACAAEACYLGAWCEVSNSHITVAVPAVMPPGSLVPREAPAPAPAAAAAAAGARDAYGEDPAWPLHAPHSGRPGLGRLGLLSDLMGSRGMGAGPAAPAEPPLPEGWLRVEGVPYGPAEGPGPVPLTLPALRKEVMSLLTYDFEFEDEVDKAGSHVVYPVGLVIRLRKGEGEAAAAEASGASTPAAAATPTPGFSASRDGDEMGFRWGAGIGGRPAAAAAAPAAALPPVAALFGGGRFAITAPSLALHSAEAGKRKVQVLPGMTRAPAPPGGATPAGRPNAHRAGAGAAGGGGGGGWAGDEDDESSAAYGGGVSRAGASGRVVSGGGGFAASAAARSGAYGGAGEGLGVAVPSASVLRARSSLMPAAAAGHTSASAAWMDAMLGAGPGGVRRPHDIYGDDVAVLDAMRGISRPSAAAAGAPPLSRLPLSHLHAMLRGGGGSGRSLNDFQSGSPPAGGGRDADAAAAAARDAARYAQALADLGKDGDGDAAYIRALMAEMHGAPAAGSSSAPAPAPAPAPAAAAQRAPAEAQLETRSAESAEAGVAHVRGLLRSVHGPSDSSGLPPATRLHSRHGHQHHPGAAAAAAHHGAAAAAAAGADRALRSVPGGIYGAAAFGGMFGPSAPAVSGIRRHVQHDTDTDTEEEEEDEGEGTDTDADTGTEEDSDDDEEEEGEEEEDDEMPSLQDERVEAEAADAVISSGSGRHAHAHLSVHGSGSAFAAPAGAAAPAAVSAASLSAGDAAAPSAAAVGGPAAGGAAAAERKDSGVAPEGRPAPQRDDSSAAAPGASAVSAATPAAGSAEQATAATHPAQPAADGHAAAAAAVAATAAPATQAPAPGAAPPDEVFDTSSAADRSAREDFYSGVD